MKQRIISSAAVAALTAALAACAAAGGPSKTQPGTAPMKEKPVVTAGYYDLERVSVHDPPILNDV